MERTTAISETEKMAASIHDKFRGLPASFSQFSIYRVPEYVSEGKESCYRPLLVSIGPVYFDASYLLAMEEHKLSFLRSFLQHRSNPHDLQHYIDFIREREISIRDCYEQDVSSIPSNKFVEMVLIDAAFTIYFLAMGNQLFPFDEDLTPMYCEIRRDLFLEDNQLPFFILEDLFRKAFSGSFRDVVGDLIAEGYMPLSGMATARSVTARERLVAESNIKHLVHIMTIFCLPSTLRSPASPEWREPCDVRFPPTVSNLEVVEVKFVPNSSRSLLDLKFEKGVLEMPILVVSDFSESLFRSIMLFEQRHNYTESYFTHYIHFLDKLIDTADDVKILVREGVLKNWLGSDQAVVELFNGIADRAVFEVSYFRYKNECEDLIKFTKTKWNQWKAILRTKYFGNPWSVISVICAVILLILTVLQTINSFTSSKPATPAAAPASSRLGC